MTSDFSAVTEVPGHGASAEQLEMMRTRYHLARGLGEGRDVLEVACGAGMGLGYLARRARSVVGGDCTRPLLEVAKAHYGSRLPLLQLDAQALPFRDARFDVVLLYEALYYVPDFRRFLAEARRVLRPAGSLVVSSVNREWPEFNPSPHSIRYWSARELKEAVESAGFRVEVRAAFEAAPAGWRARMVSWLRRAAVKLGVIPKTMRGKELLKRLFYGRLAEIPREVDEGPVRPSVTVDQAPVTGFKVLYVVARPA